MIYVKEGKTKKLPGITSLFVTFDFNKLIVEEIKLLPTANYDNQEKTWEIPITSLAEFLDRVCKIDSITVELLPYTENCDKELLTVNTENYITQPFSYQKEGIEYGLNHDSWLLLDAPGLGKTLQLTYLAQELKQREGLEHCLIICGVNTLKTNWKTEIEKHSNLSCRILGQRVTRRGNVVIDGIPERLKQLQNPIDEFFIITNIETIRNDDITKAILNNKVNKIDMIVVDEIHTTKNHQSAQGKNLLKLTKAKYKVGATGTLLLNNPFDTYVPLKWIGAERSTFSNFKYYYGVYGGVFNNDLIGFKNIDHLKYQLDKYSLRRTKDILGLPPKNIINEYVDMSDAQSIFYNNIKEGIISQVDKVKMSTANLLAMVSRLRQATALPTILTTENISSAKVDRAIDLTEQILAGGDKVVIFSTFKDTVYELYKKLCNYGVVMGTGDQSDFEIEDAKYRFQNDPSVKIFLATWQRCGTGITLTAASYAIFIDTPWTAAVLEQCEDRIHRIGSKTPVFIYRLITNGTIDERVMEIVNDKKALSSYVVDDEVPLECIDSLRKYIQELV